MKIHFFKKDEAVIRMFLSQWVEQGVHLGALSADECEPIYFDCSSDELSNCFMELNKKGFSQSAKEIFQGNHFYRSDTGKCARCWRYRPEIHWNNENIPECEASVCDRCANVLTNQRKETFK